MPQHTFYPEELLAAIVPAVAATGVAMIAADEIDRLQFNTEPENIVMLSMLWLFGFYGSARVYESTVGVGVR